MVLVLVLRFRKLRCITRDFIFVLLGRSRSMSVNEWVLIFVLAVPAMAIALWIRLLRLELNESKRKEKVH